MSGTGTASSIPVSAGAIDDVHSHPIRVERAGDGDPAASTAGSLVSRFGFDERDRALAGLPGGAVERGAGKIGLGEQRSCEVGSRHVGTGEPGSATGHDPVSQLVEWAVTIIQFEGSLGDQDEQHTHHDCGQPAVGTTGSETSEYGDDRDRQAPEGSTDDAT
jgi:hypothetical protein